MTFVEDLTQKYLEEFALQEREVFNAFIRSFDDLCSTGPTLYRKILKTPLESLTQFSNSKVAVESLEIALTEIENRIQDFTVDAERTKDKFKPIKETVDEILKIYYGALQKIIGVIDDKFQEIGNCPSGQKEHGLIFQELILEILDVIFIHEFLREEDTSKYKGIRLDGFYIKSDSFDSKERTGFSFDKLIVECKNKRPSVNDLMQCFKYTLFFKNTEIDRIPLTLLVCRDAPAENSSIWKIAKMIFDRKIEDETRLILLLTVSDIGEMRVNKRNGADPAKVIKDKIRTLYHF